MFAQVVVLTYQPPDIDSYTYKVPKDLEKIIKPGQLVPVPFGKRNPLGIIIHLRGVHSARLASKRATSEVSKKIKIKPITSIIYPTPILLPYQIELLKWMAFYYHAPMVNCLEAMLPTKALNAKRLMTNAKITYQSLSRSSLVVSQILILVPSINRIPETLAKYPQAKNYAVYHNELKSAERFNTWQKILSQNTDYIFGSRSAIFTPCPNLKEIIIYDEHDQGYKDERSPYYNTLTIAEKLQGLTGARIKIVDSSPRITTYYLVRSNLARDSARFDLDLGSRDSTKNSLASLKVKTVNMQDARRAGNKSGLSQILQDYIKLGYAKKKKILLFLNKKTESGHVYCRNCQYSEFALIQPAVCPNCQSPDIWFSSLNVNSLASVVQKIVPSARINLLIRSDLDGKGTIDIATAAVFYKLMPKIYDLVAHIQTDSLATLTDYTSGEKLFAQITSLKKITRGLLLLQTYNALDPTIISASLGNYQKFFQDQLTERRALSYPPFSLLVKLSTRAKLEENLEEKAQKLYEELIRSNLARGSARFDLGITILGPYKPQFTGKTAKYNIILKLPLKNYSLLEREMAIKTISPQFSLVPHGWQVEVEAESII